MRTILLIGERRACEDWIRINFNGSNLIPESHIKRGVIDISYIRFRFINRIDQTYGWPDDTRFIVLYGADRSTVDACSARFQRCEDETDK